MDSHPIPVAEPGSELSLWRRTPRGLRWTAGVGCGVVVLCLIAWLSLLASVAHSLRTPYDGKDKLPFTRDAWLAGDKDWDGSRYLMMDDLAAKHPLVGMTRDQVLELLGPMQPPGYPGFGDCYYLGPENHPLAVDNAWLVLTFENDVVRAWRLATD